MNILSGQPVQPPHYISFSAEINQVTIEHLILQIANISNSGVKQVHLLFSTPGGNVQQGITLYNTLRAFPIELITHNVGNVDSIGSVVFLAGQKRYAAQHSTFMFHGVTMETPGKVRFGEIELEQHMTSLTTEHGRIASIVAERTNLTEEDVREFFKKQRTLTPDEAKAASIIHDIKEAKVSAGSPVFPLIFNR